MTHTCTHCQTPFSGKPARRYCSLKCYAQWRERQPGWQEARKRGIRNSIATKRRQSLRQCAGKAEQCASKAAAWREGERNGFRKGWHAGERAGVIKGREQGYMDGLRQARYEAVMGKTA
jgi:flagellar biosynthesis/type III secretory pathway protein FliH